MTLFKMLFVVATIALSGFAFATGTVDINSADAQTLQTLDGIGPAKAQAIVAYRQANGPFKSVDDLSKVDGIGDKTLEANRSKIALNGGAAAKKKPPAKN